MGITVSIIIGCAAASLWAWSGNSEYIWKQWGHVPYLMRLRGEWHRLFTGVFFHSDIMHLALNSFVFYSFGRLMETYYGKSLYLLLLLMGLIGSGLATYLRYRNNPYYISIGLSGVVNAVVFSFILLNPTTTLIVWFLPLPAWVFALLYIAYSIYGGFQEGGYINHWAHLGGAAAGVFFALMDLYILPM
ncbi:MAG: rhomboid family intramembrane serine protease [Bacteroidia bacterium]|nr:rhomboid family intramembrane serine protease [Bacteroidia bacterium]MCX7651433.1 rhomboid family intramembrane serine protease [Bacteroidia bacterium]MDW8417068.1 rhomboid family intramembrane serine protease [Bacteroidia bacterium]